jgi:hypothetical protein
MKKQWKIFASESCPNCGDNLKVLSSSLESKDTEFEQWFSDEEEVECCGACGFKSAISVSEEGDAWIQDGNIDELSIND